MSTWPGDLASLLRKIGGCQRTGRSKSDAAVAGIAAEARSRRAAPRSENCEREIDGRGKVRVMDVGWRGDGNTTRCARDTTYMAPKQLADATSRGRANFSVGWCCRVSRADARSGEHAADLSAARGDTLTRHTAIVPSLDPVSSRDPSRLDRVLLARRNLKPEAATEGADRVELFSRRCRRWDGSSAPNTS